MARRGGYILWHKADRGRADYNLRQGVEAVARLTARIARMEAQGAPESEIAEERKWLAVAERNTDLFRREVEKIEESRAMDRREAA